MTEGLFSSATQQLHGELGSIWRGAARRAAEQAQRDPRIECNQRDKPGAAPCPVQRRRLTAAWRAATVLVSVVPIALALHVAFFFNP